MKTTARSALLFAPVLLVVSSFAQQRQARTSGPSQQETVSWLHDKLLTLGGLSFTWKGKSPVETTVVLHYTDFKVAATAVELSSETTVDRSDDSFHDENQTTERFSLRDLDFDSATTKTYKAGEGAEGCDGMRLFVRGVQPCVQLSIPTIGRKESVRWEMTHPEFPLGKTGTRAGVYVFFADPDLASRVLAALKHAAELSEPEPF